MIDDLPDNDSDSSDYIGIDFDLNKDGIRDQNLSMGEDRDPFYAFSMPGNDLLYIGWGFTSSPNKAEDHTIIEIKIPITFESSYDGSSNGSQLDALPVGNSDNPIKILITAIPPVCNWTIPVDGSVLDTNSYAELILKASAPAIPGYTLFWTIIAAIGAGMVMILRKYR